MSEDKSEKQQEASETLDKMKRLSELMYSSLVKVLKAKTAVDAKKGLYEAAFYQLAHERSIPVLARLNNFENDIVSYHAETMQELMDMLEETEKGNWKKTKDYFSEILIDSELLADANKYGLDPNFEHYGEKIFLNEIGPVSAQVDSAQRNYVSRKICLIPDQTEPYVYSDIEQLKRSIEIA